MQRMRHPATVVCTVLLAGLAGCTPTNHEELAKAVVKSDPDFKAVLDKHRELSNRIETYERELTLKRTTVEHQITQMRQDLATATANVRARIDEVKKRMEPDRQRLALALAMASEELQAKRQQRASLGRSIARLRKALKQSGAGWSAQDVKKQQSQIDEMTTDTKRLDQEMASLKEHLRLLKIKLLLIKL